MISQISKKTVKNQLFNVFAHDLRTKDETKCFEIKAKSRDEALAFFLEDFSQKHWYVQEVELA